MNGAHLHLLFNHLPIVGTYLALLTLLSGYVVKNSIVKNTGLFLLVVAALLAIPAFLTGEPAEDILKSARQADKKFIHEHEETAEWAIWICEIAGVLALIALYASLKKLKAAGTLIGIVTLLAIMSSLAWIKVGNSGGEIRHTEIRDGNSVQNTGGGGGEDDD